MQFLSTIKRENLKELMDWDITNYIPTHPILLNNFYRVEKNTPLDLELLDLEIPTADDDEVLVEDNIEKENISLPLQFGDIDDMVDKAIRQRLKRAQKIDAHAYTTIHKQVDINESYKEQQKKYIYNKACLKEVTQDNSYYQIALLNEREFYQNMKQERRQELADNLSEVINQTFDTDYEFYFKPDVQKKYTYYHLMSLNRRGAISMILGGAVTQTTGVVIDIGILRYRGSNFLSLDEAFSSFSPENVRKVKDFILESDDMQFMFVENKVEVKEELADFDKVTLFRTKKRGAYIEDLEDNSGELRNALVYIFNCMDRMYTDDGKVYQLIRNENGEVIDKQLIQEA